MNIVSIKVFHSQYSPVRLIETVYSKLKEIAMQRVEVSEEIEDNH